MIDIIYAFPCIEFVRCAVLLNSYTFYKRKNKFVLSFFFGSTNSRVLLYRHMRHCTTLTNSYPLSAESISLLDALKIQDHGSFIVSSMAFRCLPASTRKLFESSAPPDFPSVTDLLTFVQSRVAVLEKTGDHQKRPNNHQSQ